MNPIPRRILAPAALFLGISACTLPVTEVPERTPVRWIMVEKPVGELISSGANGQGQVDPQALIVTLQPLYPEDLEWEVVVDPHDFFVEILEITPKKQASPGEIVTAKVHVARARPGENYRLMIKATRPEVEVIGRSEENVKGGAPALFRFTSTIPGPGGIAVGVERVSQ